MSAVPTKRLFDPDRKTQLAYVPANSTDITLTWKLWRESLKEEVTADSYQRDVLAEARARKIKTK